MARATGIGSMPGTDFVESLKIATQAVPELPFVPELPARGPHAGTIGRTLGLITDLGADLQPDGWRIGVGEGLDQRRARSLLAHDLDVAEEALTEYAGPLKVQVTGPLTLAASVERPRGDKMLADHGARRELAEVLAGALATHVADLRHRFPKAQLVLQLDEPAIRRVMEGRVPTASGWATHRRVDPPEADALLRKVVEVVVETGAAPVLHSSSPDVPVALLHGLGFSALSFDLSLARPGDVWAEAFDDGMDLWIGALPTDGSVGAVRGADLAREFVHRLGFSPDAVADRLVVSAAGDLAGLTPARARQLLVDTHELAARLDPT